LSTASLKTQINVTPLADVMLVLLIIFMVVTPMLKTGVDVKVPEADHPAKHPDDDRTLVLSLREDGTFFLNQDSVAREDLFTKLSTVMESRAEKVLFIKAGELLDYGDVLGVMDLCRRAGAEEVALITRDKTS
jgi:biopolymer transport protein TolR